MFYLFAASFADQNPTFQSSTCTLQRCAFESKEAVSSFLQTNIARSDLNTSCTTWTPAMPGRMTDLIWGRIEKNPNDFHVPHVISIDGKNIGFATIGLWGEREHFVCALTDYTYLPLAWKTIIEFYRSISECSGKEVITSTHPKLITDEMLSQGWKEISQNPDSGAALWMQMLNSLHNSQPLPAGLNTLEGVIGGNNLPDDAAQRIQLVLKLGKYGSKSAEI